MLSMFYQSDNINSKRPGFSVYFFNHTDFTLSGNECTDGKDSNYYQHACLHLKFLSFFVSYIGQAVEEHLILP
jgi:hypothetical protein